MSSIRSTVARLFDGLSTEVPDAPDADFVVAPSDAEGVARVLDVASEHRLTVVPWGSGVHQGMGGRVTPDIVVSTNEMSEVVDWRPDDLTVVVDAGVTVADLESLLAERGQTAVLTDTTRDATVGGVVAAGVSGYRRLRYGPTHDRLLQVVLTTGDGRVVTAGGQVVKNVTGYDVPRLVAGSFGSLGVITRLCFKLWPLGSAEATFEVSDPADAFAATHRPLAVLEVDGRGVVMVSGTPEEIAGQAERLGAEPKEGLRWPSQPTGPIRLSVRVPPGQVRAAIDRLPDPRGYVAQHGVGEVAAAFDDVAPDAVTELRGWAESIGGAVVVVEAPAEWYELVDPWGTPPTTLDLQRRVKAAFDPIGVMVPGRLPGGL